MRTAEAGKAVGVRQAKGEIICLLDSDNIIPDANWITRMMKPFEEDMIPTIGANGFFMRKKELLENLEAIVRLKRRQKRSFMKWRTMIE